MFIHGGSKNEMLMSISSTEEYQIWEQCKDVALFFKFLVAHLLTILQDALMWVITNFGWFQYRIKFPDANTMDKFTNLANLWEPSRVKSTTDITDIETALKGHVSTLAACQWDDDNVAFTEIDMLTSTFALFQISY
jgi:hypothetical protein